MFRRWKPRPRFRLRTLLLVVTGLCLLLTALPFEARQYHHRKARVRSLIVRLGGSVDTCGFSDDPSPGANWVSELLGYVEPREAQWEVTLKGASVTSSELGKLRGCNWIRSLDLSNTNVADDAMEDVASLEKLIELRLRNTRVTDSGLLKLKPLNLFILDVAETAATYASLAELERGRTVQVNLQEQLAITRVRAAGILVDLGTLAMSAKLPPQSSVSPAAVIASIQADLTNFGLQPEAAGAVHITQPMALTAANIEDLRRLVSAKSFETSGVKFPPGGLRVLSDLENLESVKIDEARTGNLTDDDLRWLAKMPSLKTLEIRSSNLTDDGIARLASTPLLTSLSLSGSGFTDNVFAPFREAHQLESLSVHANNLTPELVANLRGLPKLRQLELKLWYLGPGRQSEAVLPEPPAEPGSQWIFGRPPREVIDATRESLDHLAAIPNLKHLTVVGNLLVADALTPIMKLTGLEWLKVDGRYVSHEDARQLQVAMPHCHVQRLNLE